MLLCGRMAVLLFSLCYSIAGEYYRSVATACMRRCISLNVYWFTEPLSTQCTLHQLVLRVTTG
jgi:hypothetical protein